MPSSFPSQIADLRTEFQSENEEMLETIRELSREVKLQNLIINNFVPAEYQVNPWLSYRTDN